VSEVFLFVLGILVMSYGYWLFELHLKRKNETDDDAVRAEMRERCRKLEERIRVLERIVTDSGDDLERKFRELRD
jgi:hypothetical protein